jgi:DNA-binding beta-propeller fold protein YncE
MRTQILSLLGCLAFVAPTLCGADDLRVSHLYELSDFNGTVPYSDVVLHADRHHDEVYAVVGNTVRVFNHSGMEIYRFQHDPTVSKILDLGVEESGDIFTLNFDRQARDDAPSWWINRCDYRGELTGRIDVSGLPDEIEPFSPSRMILRDGRIVLVSTGQLQVVVVDESGVFQKRHDLAGLLDIDDPATNVISGFSIDRSGNMLFTIPVRFSAYVVAPDETVRQFGSAGSAPGKFGVVAGIVASDDGHYVVADKLRGLVMVFDSSFRVVKEFAGVNRGALARPTALAFGNSGRLYVTQAQERGVAVFALSGSTVSDGSSSSGISQDRS